MYQGSIMILKKKTITKGVQQIMEQGVLPFEYEEEKKDTGITGLAGLPLYLDLARVVCLSKSIQKHLKIKEGGQGWTDVQMVISLILLNLAGGECVDDLKILEADEGFCEILCKIEVDGLTRKIRRALARRWRKEQQRTVPSPSTVFRYLKGFHDAEQEELRKQSKVKAFIPAPSEHLKGFSKINKDLLAILNTIIVHKTATLDMDATLIETSKKSALYSYKSSKAYQPLNTWWYEHNIIVHTEFRDGNVPAGYEQLRVLKEALECLPGNVKEVKLRSDTAGYQHDLLKYCETGANERFGRIEFAIGCKVSKSFKIAVAQVPSNEWHPLYKTVNGRRVKTKTEWAEVCFVPDELCHSKNAPEYRYIAKRQLIDEQRTLPGMEEPDLELVDFPTMQMTEGKYKVFGIVTNIKECQKNGEEVIHWLHARCGKSEEAHSVMKEDLAGGKLPSWDFGANAAWWWIMILSLNVNSIMKQLALEPSMEKARMKRVRFTIINIPGRILKGSRNLLIKLSKGNPSYRLFLDVRERLMMVNERLAPSG